MSDDAYQSGIVIDEEKYRAKLRADEEAFRAKIANEKFRGRITACMVISTASLVLIVIMLATVFIRLRLYENWRP